MTDLDLFGNPDPPPRKGAIGYLTWIAELSYPDGYQFWSLAAIPRPKNLPADTTEMVWLLGPAGKWLQAAIDITDGTILTDRETAS